MPRGDGRSVKIRSVGSGAIIEVLCAAVVAEQYPKIRLGIVDADAWLACSLIQESNIERDPVVRGIVRRRPIKLNEQTMVSENLSPARSGRKIPPNICGEVGGTLKPDATDPEV